MKKIWNLVNSTHQFDFLDVFWQYKMLILGEMDELSVNFSVNLKLLQNLKFI